MGELSESDTDSQSGSRVRFSNRDSNNDSPVTGLSSFEDVRFDDDVEEEIQFEKEGEEEGYQRGGNDSEASSTVGSDVAGFAKASPHDYVNMTGDNVCRVLMTRQKGGVPVACVCGNNRNTCDRKGHLNKQGVAHKEGLPRFYIKFPGTRGVMDGRLDRMALTRSEGERELQESRDEMARMAQVLSDATIDDDSDGVESVTYLATRDGNPTAKATAAMKTTPQVSNTNFVNRFTKYVMGSAGRSAGSNSSRKDSGSVGRSISPPLRGILGNGSRNNDAPADYSISPPARRSPTVFTENGSGTLVLPFPGNTASDDTNEIDISPNALRALLRRPTSTLDTFQPDVPFQESTYHATNIRSPSPEVSTRTRDSVKSTSGSINGRGHASNATSRRGNAGTGGTNRTITGGILPKTNRNATTAPTSNRTSFVPKSLTTWVGVEHSSTFARIYFEDDAGVIAEARRRGYVTKMTFNTQEAAQQWTDEAAPISKRETSRPRPAVDRFMPSVTHGRLERPRPAVDRFIPAATHGRMERQTNDGRSSQLRRTQDAPSANIVYNRGSGNTNRVSNQGRFEPTVVHNLSTITGDPPNSDDDSSCGEIYRAAPPSRRRSKAKSQKNQRSWYGVERSIDWERAVTNRLRTLRELQCDGFDLKEVFATKDEAVRWMNEALFEIPNIVTNSSEDESEGIMFSGNREVSKKKVLKHNKVSKVTSVVPPTTVSTVPTPTPSIPPSSTPTIYLEVVPPSRSLISLGSADFFRAETAGADPSNGNKEQIYNIPHDNVAEMDIAMCPPHMTATERENFLETVVDITALPGMFRSGDGGDTTMDTDTATSIVATALGKRVSMTDVMWRSPAKNALSRVKSMEQLYDTINGVERSGRIAFQQQEGRMRAIMYKCNYDRTSIQLYLQAGLLPRMMRASHDRYIALLYKARQKVIEHGSWDYSLGYEIVTHHARETHNLRQYSVDWRNFVIQTYIYLRDAERKSYVDETMYEALFKRHRENLPPEPRGRDRPSGADEPRVCSYCRCPIGKAHPGGKGSCAFVTLTSAKAKEAGRQLMSALEESPRLDKSKKIKELLEEHGGSK